MRNKITFTEENLVVEPQGLDKLWSFTGALTIPWNHVRGATHDPGMKKEPKGFRAPGLRIGQKLSGTFHSDGERTFYNVNGFENALVVELVDEHFTRLVVTADNPADQAQAINSHARAE
ncbi:hypothetical protein [Corynebacterium auriscanis]|uniref:Bacterial Pleckstrin homology domain-containing protein n=1 Tax=Corynebacterium auriscanis TaxID=99807 RepID=A0A0A2DMB4_9CORY|nr:hypothetical protein [Corynebacterium auriscanis]KGM18016.1 hypothetical protein MA47_11035 [Corynebacterium auriscanis]WJY71947.1 hypothetical protein CAURIC_01345 [Corynebacterium auriscanis]